MRNFPAHIPASQSQTLPPQRREPASASATQIDILYLSFILSDFFDFMRIPEVRKLSFHFNVLCPRVSDIFFMRRSVGSVVFVSGA